MQKESKRIRITNNEFFNYYIYKPINVKGKLPVLLFLHGIGERGTTIKEIEKYSLPKYMNKFDIPYIVIAPQCLKNNFWDYHLRDVERILDIECQNEKIDKNNIFVVGSSMGAFGAWNYIMQRPEIFRGIISVSGGIMLPIKQNLEMIRNKAILIYHGDKDDVVDVNESIDAYNKLKDIGASNIELKIIENDNHYLTSHAFKDKYIYEWLNKNLKGEY